VIEGISEGSSMFIELTREAKEVQCLPSLQGKRRKFSVYRAYKVSEGSSIFTEFTWYPKVFA